MPIESTRAGVVITGEDGISMFRLLQFKHALRLEIVTGMRHSKGSILSAYNRSYGTAYRTKRQALEDCLNRIALAEVSR